MTKRGRIGDEDEVARAIQRICMRPMREGEADGLALTPLERQVVTLKGSIPPHVILMVACGYKVKFYGRDSRVASRRLGIVCVPGQPFEYSSVPYARVDLYVHRLVAMGYHVGFADQESAAVRAAEGVSSGLFTRVVSQLYSRGTLLPSEHLGAATATPADGAVEDADDTVEAAPAVIADEDASELFMCFVGQPSNPSQPVPMVLVSFVSHRRACFWCTTALEAEDIVQRFDIVEVIIVSYADDKTAKTSTCPLAAAPEYVASVLRTTLPLQMGPTVTGEEDGQSVSVCTYTAASGTTLDDAIRGYLRSYKLDHVYDRLCAVSTTSQDFSTPAVSSLNLPGSALRALEVFRSGSSSTGSLLSLLDHNVTACGGRRLRAWLAAPLVSVSDIVERQEVVAFLVSERDQGGVEEILREGRRVGDVEATLGKLRAQRCSVVEYLRLLRLIQTVSVLAKALLDSCLAPPLLKRVLAGITAPSTEVVLKHHQLEMKSTAASPLELLTLAETEVPEELLVHLHARDEAIRALEEELTRVRELLALPGLEYRTIAGTPYVLDIPSSKSSRVPPDWTVLTRTRTNVRYHTATIIRENINVSAAKERLAQAACHAWQSRQAAFCDRAADVQVVHEVIEVLAVLDVLRCLAVTSSASGYVAPRMVAPALSDADDGKEAPGLVIKGGRHPVLGHLLGPVYVSCDVHLSPGGGTWLLTGPNMGGKSALMRMVGTFVILAQMGCYVPAVSACLPVFTGLYCRMGASDAILEGASTFLSEMQETSRILHARDLPRSLVLMDELGRGTSSFDGVAVAAATLEFLIKAKATTIFVTHYTDLCDPYRGPNGDPRVECFFMGFQHEDLTAVKGEAHGAAEGGRSRLVFTYKPCRGITPSSFGVEIAKMAGLPSNVTAAAQRRSIDEENQHAMRTDLTLVGQFVRGVGAGVGHGGLL